MSIFASWKDEDFYYSPMASHVYLYGKVDVTNAAKFRVALHKTTKKPIVVHVHSQGGYASLGISISNMIREVSVPVAVVVDGYACSAITPLLVTAPYRVMHDFSFVLLHEISLPFLHDEVVKIGDLDFKGKDLTAMLAEYRRIYESNTKIPPKMMELLSRDMFLKSSDCSKYSIVDRVIKLEKKHLHARWLQTNYPLSSNMSKTNPSLWEPSLKHLFMANTATNSSESITSDAALSGIIKCMRAAGKPNAKPNVSNVERPILMHVNSMLSPTISWFDIATLLAHTYCLKVPVMSVIDSDIDIIKALPTIMSYKRYMYDNAYVTIRLLHDHKSLPSLYYHDIKYNTELLRDALKKVLKQYTKLPQSMIQSLFEKRIILTARQCKEYGLIDYIIPAIKRKSIRGGCGCSQGLAYDGTAPV